MISHSQVVNRGMFSPWKTPLAIFVPHILLSTERDEWVLFSSNILVEWCASFQKYDWNPEWLPSMNLTFVNHHILNSNIFLREKRVTRGFK